MVTSVMKISDYYCAIWGCVITRYPSPVHDPIKVGSLLVFAIFLNGVTLGAGPSEEGLSCCSHSYALVIGIFVNYTVKSIII